MRTWIVCAAIGLTLALAGCAGAPAPREQFFTLGPAAPAKAPPASQSPTVFVGPVSVPEAVDRTSMVLTTGPNQVDVSDDLRWAEPLRSAIPRFLAEALSRELGSSRVLASRAAAGTPVDFRVAVEVQRFDSSLEEGATIDALWTVSTPSGPSRSGRSTVREPASSHDAAGVVAAHARALERVAGDIAQAIRAAGPR